MNLIHSFQIGSLVLLSSFIPYQSQGGPCFTTFVILKQTLDLIILFRFFSNIFVFYQVQITFTKHVYSAPFTMFDHPQYYSPFDNDPPLERTRAQRSDAASSGYAYGTADTCNTSPSPGDPGGPSTSFPQTLSMDDDRSDPFFETGQSVALYAPTTTQQEPSTVEAVDDEIMWQPLSVDDDHDLSNPFPETSQSVASDALTMIQQQSSTSEAVIDDHDLSDPFPENGQSVASDASTTTQQEPSTSEVVNDQIMRQPLSVESITSDHVESAQQEQQSCSDVSAYNLFHVSFASEADLGILSEIHARASVHNHLARSTMHDPEHFDSHLEIGRFHYGQAFAAKGRAIILKAIVLKAINKGSGEIVGCAWLQQHIFYRNNKEIAVCQPGYPLPCCLKKQFYTWVHGQIHQHRQIALEKSGTREYGTLHYCKYFRDVPP